MSNYGIEKYLSNSRFYHPQGEIITTVCSNITIMAGQSIKLQDVKCKLHFVSTFDGIEQLLTSFVPRINVCDATVSERKCISQIFLDVKKLFVDKKVS